MRGDHSTTWLFTIGNNRVLATGRRRARRAGEGKDQRNTRGENGGPTATQAVRWRRGAARYVGGGSGRGQRANGSLTSGCQLPEMRDAASV